MALTAGALRIDIPVSAGELVDKVTILEIKSERISDQAKQANVRRELARLAAILSPLLADEPRLPPLKAELRTVNETLWQIEDDIRDFERRNCFGADFVALARAVYRTNDQRYALKRQIDELVASEIVEEKSYRTIPRSIGNLSNESPSPSRSTRTAIGRLPREFITDAVPVASLVLFGVGDISEVGTYGHSGSSRNLADNRMVVTYFRDQASRPHPKQAKFEWFCSGLHILHGSAKPLDWGRIRALGPLFQRGDWLGSLWNVSDFSRESGHRRVRARGLYGGDLCGSRDA